MAFIGARGSGQPLDSYEGFGREVTDVYNGYLDARGEDSNAGDPADTKRIPLKYLASDLPYPIGYNELFVPPVGHLPVLASGVTMAMFAYSIWDGVDKLVSVLKSEHSRCGASGQKYILSGYSQGSLVIRLAVAELGTSWSDRVIGVALVSDPGRYASSGYSGLNAFEFNDRKGMWSSTIGGSVDQTPSWFGLRNTFMCDKYDLVCSAGWGSNFDNHSYNTDELKFLGAKLSEAITAAR